MVQIYKEGGATSFPIIPFCCAGNQEEQENEKEEGKKRRVPRGEKKHEDGSKLLRYLW